MYVSFILISTQVMGTANGDKFQVKGVLASSRMDAHGLPTLLAAEWHTSLDFFHMSLPLSW
jgi:hypothetical protein